MVNQKTPNNIVNLSVESFKVCKESNDSDSNDSNSKVKIEGFALPFDTVSRNGFEYSTESIKATAATLEGRSMFFNHNVEELPIGKVKQVEVKDDGLYFVGELCNKTEREKEIVEKVREGMIENVSIQCMYENAKYDESQDSVKVDVKEFLELSVVTIPGFGETTLQAVENFKQMSKVKEELNKVKQENAAVTEQDDETEMTVEARLDNIESKQAEIENRIGTIESRLDVEDEEEEAETEESDEGEKPETEEESETEESEEEENESEESLNRATAQTSKESKKKFSQSDWRKERLMNH